MEKLCDNCNNMMNIKIKDADTLVLDCPSCNHVKPWTGSSCIYETNYTVDLSKIINTNVNISQDNTLPSIKDNPNIKCINKKLVLNPIQSVLIYQESYSYMLYNIFF